MEIILNDNHDVLQQFRTDQFENLLNEGCEYKSNKKKLL